MAKEILIHGPIFRREETMKNSICSYCSAIAVLLLPFSCSRLEEQEQKPMETMGEEAVWTMSVEASKGEEEEAETRALILEGNTLNAVWSEGDVVTVKKGTETIGSLTAQNGGTNTLLKGNLTTAVAPGDVLILSYLTGSYDAQDGTLAYISSHCDYAVATVTVTGVSGNDVITDNAVFKNQQAINEFDFTIGGVPAQISLLKVYFKANKKIYVRPSSARSKIFFAINREWNDTNLYYFCAEVDGELYYGKGKVSLVNGKYYKAPVALQRPTYTEPEAVDLGLPSGVKWASMNLGAVAEYDMGYYYAWGETTPKMDYTVQNYVHCDGREDENHIMVRLLKYNNNTSYGIVDNKKTLQDMDDAAKVNLGGLWRMPTQTEVEELLANTTWTRTVNAASRVKGYRVTSKINGNSIFFPINGDVTNGQTSYGYYWTSSLDVANSSSNSTNSARFARTLEMDYRTLTPSDYWEPIRMRSSASSRTVPHGIRPVYVSEAKHVTSVDIHSSEISLPRGGFQRLTAGVSPADAANVAVAWSSSDENVAIVDQQGMVTAVGMGSAVITVTTMDMGKTDTCPVTVTDPAYQMPGIVDMGLSVKWTSFNMGATAAEEYGDYFAWGELAPKSTYYESGNKWYRNGLYTKYCTQANYGIVDNLVSLEPEDDAALFHLGVMRMPTSAEWTELQNNSTWEWTEMNGVKGVRATSKKAGYTDKWIFLPAAGYRYESYLQNTESLCEYWTSSLSTSDPRYASFGLYRSNNSSVSLSAQWRKYGLPIRPVIDPSSFVPLAGISIGEEDLTMDPGETVPLTATLSPSNATFSSITWSSSVESVATVDEYGVLTAIGAGVTVISASTLEGLVATRKVKVLGSELVDLGLSVLWAKSNLGTDRPEKAGSFYAWGEVEPKTSFSWANYQWCDGTEKSRTKYCIDAEYGTVDNKTVLDWEDDAAYVNSGGRVHTPTSAQWQELLDNCSWSWGAYYGRMGYYVTGPTNNSIFLPACGYPDGSGVDTSAVYWSSSLHTNKNYAWCLYLTSTTKRGISDVTYYGSSVRAVSF